MLPELVTRYFKSNGDIDIDILQKKSDDGTDDGLFIKEVTAITILNTNFRYFLNDKIFSFFFQQNIIAIV